ncbi:MAG TPA: plastocyanin/azurin family copper-binding protein [Candidatus Dormibacteraeota bacterium]|jgi:plastocyanin
MHAAARLRVAHLLAAAAVLGALLQPGQGRAASTHAVTVAGSGTTQAPYVYEGVPASVTAGDTVTWLNPTTVNHTVTPTQTPDAGFRSHDLNGQGSYHEYRFTVPGSYAFHCQNHPDTMHATLTVTPAPSPTPSPAPTAVPAPRPASTPPLTGRAAAISPTAAPPAPSRGATPAPRPTATPATPVPSVAATETPSSDAETDTVTATTSGSILPTAPQPPPTATPAADHGRPSVPVALGLLALLVAVTAGAVAQRRRG